MYPKDGELLQDCHIIVHCPSVYCIMHLMISRNSPLFLLLVQCQMPSLLLYIFALVYVTLYIQEVKVL